MAIQKQALLDLIQEGIRTEESAVVIYLKHLDAIVTRSGLPADRIEKARNYMNFLVASNKKHKALLEGLAASIRGEARNVF